MYAPVSWSSYSAVLVVLFGRHGEQLGGGVFQGSTLLVSGGAGTEETCIAASLADAACARGQRALFVSFEESPAQLLRNPRSIGLDLAR